MGKSKLTKEIAPVVIFQAKPNESRKQAKAFFAASHLVRDETRFMISLGASLKPSTINMGNPLYKQTDWHRHCESRLSCFLYKHQPALAILRTGGTGLQTKKEKALFSEEINWRTYISQKKVFHNWSIFSKKATNQPPVFLLTSHEETQLVGPISRAPVYYTFINCARTHRHPVTRFIPKPSGCSKTMSGSAIGKPYFCSRWWASLKSSVSMGKVS